MAWDVRPLVIAGVVTGGVTTFVVKVAVTFVVALTVTEHVPVPLHDPDHPVKVEPDAALALSETAVPLFTDSEHVDPQLMEPPLTVPEPVPALATVRVYLVTAADATIIVRVALPVPPLFDAEIDTLYVPAVGGVPEMRPTPFTESPAGRPLAL